MRITALDELGFRFMLHFARSGDANTVSARQIADSEGLSPEHAAKLLGQLRNAGLLISVRGAHGGYRLTRPADEITLWDILEALESESAAIDGRFCSRFPGTRGECVWSPDCAIRAVWRALRDHTRQLLCEIRLAELNRPETEMAHLLEVHSFSAGER